MSTQDTSREQSPFGHGGPKEVETQRALNGKEAKKQLHE